MKIDEKLTDRALQIWNYISEDKTSRSVMEAFLAQLCREMTKVYNRIDKVGWYEEPYANPTLAVQNAYLFNIEKVPCEHVPSQYDQVLTVIPPIHIAKNQCFKCGKHLVMKWEVKDES